MVSRRVKIHLSSQTIINNYLSQKLHVGIIYIDFRRAFETLEHDVLLKSMEECGIRGKLINWFKEYLRGRKFSTKIKDFVGDCEDVMYGVATGSVTGPACYIMHVNSMVNVVEACKIYMFADDTCIMYAERDLQLMQRCLQQDLDNITRWAHDNGIILNLNKTHVMHINSSYTRDNKDAILKSRATPMIVYIEIILFAPATILSN